MIILDEYKYALYILENHFIGNKPSKTINILARYYRHKEGKKTKEIISLLDEFMENYYPFYNSVKWANFLESQAKKSEKYPLVEIPYVPITKSELEVIDGLDSIREKRFIFTMLACAKFYNLRNPNNNNWVNREQKELFKLANNNNDTVKEQCHVIFILKEKGLISFSKKIDNLNLRVEFVDTSEDAEVVLRLNDFRELGLEYMAYTGKQLIRCQKCGRLINSTNKTRKYCNDCNKHQSVEYKTIICKDCGCSVVISSHNSKTVRCSYCQQQYDKKRNKLWKNKNKQIGNAASKN